jgi:hypothetical protein
MVTRVAATGIDGVSLMPMPTDRIIDRAKQTMAKKPVPVRDRDIILGESISKEVTSFINVSSTVPINMESLVSETNLSAILRRPLYYAAVSTGTNQTAPDPATIPSWLAWMAPFVYYAGDYHVYSVPNAEAGTLYAWRSATGSSDTNLQRSDRGLVLQTPNGSVHAALSIRAPAQSRYPVREVRTNFYSSSADSTFTASQGTSARLLYMGYGDNFGVGILTAPPTQQYTNAALPLAQLVDILDPKELADLARAKRAGSKEFTELLHTLFFTPFDPANRSTHKFAALRRSLWQSMKSTVAISKKQDAVEALRSQDSKFA